MGGMPTCINGKLIYDDVIMRTIIDLPDEQVNALAELCKLEGISRAEAIRRALSVMLTRSQTRGREQAFGAWSKRGDSRKIVNALRQEWEE